MYVSVNVLYVAVGTLEAAISLYPTLQAGDQAQRILAPISPFLLSLRAWNPELQWCPHQPGVHGELSHHKSGDSAARLVLGSHSCDSEGTQYAEGYSPSNLIWNFAFAAFTPEVASEKFPCDLSK